MYGSIYYDKEHSTIHWSEYDKLNRRFEKVEKWVPDFYIETKEESEFKSQKQKFLRPINETTFNKRRKKIKEYKECGVRVYGSDLNPETKFILERWPEDLNNPPTVYSCFIDIETECENGFPEPFKAEERISLITIWSNKNNRYTTFGFKPYTHNFEDVTYIQCENEEHLLTSFIEFIELNRHDIWSGWNSSGFDVPYIFNRILRILDNVDIAKHSELLFYIKNSNDRDSKDMYRAQLDIIENNFNFIKRLSPYGKVEKRIEMVKDQFTKEMKPQIIYNIEGVTDYDYQVLDKKFRQGKRESYKLDEVAKEEDLKGKLEYDGTIKEFYQKEWNKFVDYNIQDVRILYQLDQKLGYLSQAVYLSYKCHCLFKDGLGTVKKVESAIYNFLFKENLILDDHKTDAEMVPDEIESEEDDEVEDDKHKKIPGGYVTPKDKLRRGKHYWVSDFDVTSLYPSLMLGMNISYDSKIGQVISTNHLWDIPDDTEVTIKNGELKKCLAGEIKQLIKEKGYPISANNVIFENKERYKGILVKMIEIWFSQRKSFKKKQEHDRENALKLFGSSEEDNNGTAVTENIAGKKVTKKLSEQDYKTYLEHMRMSIIHYNLQWSCKILLNSVYGCLASQYFRFNDREVASAITLSGQCVIKNNSKELNRFYSTDFFERSIVQKNFKINKDIVSTDAVIYNDTDAAYVSFDNVMDKLNVPKTDKERLKITKFLTQMTMKKLSEFNETFFPKQFNAPNTIFFAQELIAKTVIFCQPKKYVCLILEKDGKPPKNDLLPKGLDIVRASIPKKFRQKIKEAVYMMLKDSSQEEVNKYVLQLYKDFKTWQLNDIAIPSSSNNMTKYTPTQGINFVSGCPQHMKAAVTFNYYLEKNGLTQYETIKEKDKFKMLFVGRNSKYPVESFGYKDKLPKEFDLEQFVDWNRHFERGFVKPLSQIFDAVGWSFPATQEASEDITDLFE